MTALEFGQSGYVRDSIWNEDVHLGRENAKVIGELLIEAGIWTRTAQYL